MCGDLWLSGDGRRIFTRCGNVFRASNSREQDMTYNGQLENMDCIKSATDTPSGKVLVVPCWETRLPENKPTISQVVIYSYGTLSQLETVDMPTFNNNGINYLAFGQFIFTNPSGSQYYVIVKADKDSGLLNDTGLVVKQLSP